MMGLNHRPTFASVPTRGVSAGGWYSLIMKTMKIMSGKVALCGVTLFDVRARISSSETFNFERLTYVET